MQLTKETPFYERQPAVIDVEKTTQIIIFYITTMADKIFATNVPLDRCIILCECKIYTSTILSTRHFILMRKSMSWRW